MGQTKEKKQLTPRSEYTKLRKSLLKEYNIEQLICARCGRWSRSIHLHHIKELHEGGENSAENLIPLCSECHHEWDFWDDGQFEFGTFLLTPRLKDIRKMFFGKMSMSRESLQMYRVLMMAMRGEEWAEKFCEGEDDDEFKEEYKRQNQIFNAYPYSNTVELFEQYGKVNTPVTIEDMTFVEEGTLHYDEIIRRIDFSYNAMHEARG